MISEKLLIFFIKKAYKQSTYKAYILSSLNIELGSTSDLINFVASPLKASDSLVSRPTVSG